MCAPHHRARDVFSRVFHPRRRVRPRRHPSSRATSPRRRGRARRRRRARSHRRRHPRVRHRHRRRASRDTDEVDRRSRPRSSRVDASSSRARRRGSTDVVHPDDDRDLSIHARQPTKTSVSLYVPNVRSFLSPCPSKRGVLIRSLATRRENETTKKKRNGRKRSRWRDDPRARRSSRAKRARARWRGCEGRRDTW